MNKLRQYLKRLLIRSLKKAGLVSKMGLHGQFRTYVVRQGQIIQDSGWVDNIIPNAALAVYSGLAGNTGSQNPFTYLAVGTSTTAPSAGQTALVAEITDSGLARAAATASRVTTTQTNDTLQLTYTWSVTGTKTIEEIAIFNASSSGVMGARGLTTSKSVVNGDQFVGTYKIPFSDDGV